MASKNSRLLDAVRKGRNRFSRKDLQRETGLAWGTMCNAIESLLAAGYVSARRQAPTGPGRPVVPLCLNVDSGFFVGLDVGAWETKGVVCDLGFRVLLRHKVRTPRYEGEDAFYGWLCALADTVIEQASVPREKLLGLGLSVSGNVDAEKGVIVSGGNFGLQWGGNLPAARVLQEHTGLPVHLVTSQAAGAWAEYQFGQFAGCGNLVCVGLGAGIGSGVVSDHQLLLSPPGRPVGYIGHLLIPGNKRVCRCGFRGCIEAFSGGNALAEIAAEKFPDRPELHSAEALERAAEAGDSKAKRILSTAASYDVAGIVSMIQLYLPDAIVFSGGQSRDGGFLYQRIRKELDSALPTERRERFDVAVSTLGDTQSALGAARLAYENII